MILECLNYAEDYIKIYFGHYQMTLKNFDSKLSRKR